MVLAERGGATTASAELARNGRRSRGPSPNGRATPDSSSDDENVVPFPAEKIRVGRDYQAICPELEPIEERQPDLIADRALLVWSPTLDIADNKLDEYITVAKEKYGYNGEQALGMLFWHKHDLDRAVLDLANFTPFPDEWTVEDKVLFDQAFQFHGKSFHRIRQMLPDKSIASLVKYYYSWKKTRARSSQMDRTAATQKRDGSPDRASDRASDDRESDADEKQKWTIHRGIRRGSGSPPPSLQSTRPGGTDAPQPAGAQVGEGSGEGRCTACGILCNKIMPHNAHKLCSACHAHARRTGSLRPVCGPVSRRGGPKQARFKHKLPRGIYINHDDLVAMATGSQSPAQLNLPPGDGNNVNNNGAMLGHHQQPLNQGDFMLKAMDREIVSLKRQVQTNKQQISALKRKNSDSIEDLRPGEMTSKINSRWTNDELLMAVQGVRKYGKDFQAIAETIGTKTETHVRTFWASYKRRYNLDSVLREFEAERGGGGSGPSSSVTLPTSPASGANIDNLPNQDINNGHGLTANGNGDDASEMGGSSSTTGAAGGAIGRSNSPIVIKDDKMEVDSEGCALGSIAEQGGAPTTPSKPTSKSTK